MSRLGSALPSQNRPLSCRLIASSNLFHSDSPDDDILFVSPAGYLSCSVQILSAFALVKRIQRLSPVYLLKTRLDDVAYPVCCSTRLRFSISWFPHWCPGFSDYPFWLPNSGYDLTTLLCLLFTIIFIIILCIFWYFYPSSSEIYAAPPCSTQSPITQTGATTLESHLHRQ